MRRWEVKDLRAVGKSGARLDFTPYYSARSHAKLSNLLMGGFFSFFFLLICCLAQIYSWVDLLPCVVCELEVKTFSSLLMIVSGSCTQITLTETQKAAKTH